MKTLGEKGLLTRHVWECRGDLEEDTVIFSFLPKRDALCLSYVSDLSECSVET